MQAHLLDPDLIIPIIYILEYHICKKNQDESKKILDVLNKMRIEDPLLFSRIEELKKYVN